MEAENHSNCDIAVAAAVKGFFQTNGFEWAAFVGWTRRVKFCICSDISTSGSDNEQLRMCFGLPIILSTWSKCDASNYLAKGKILTVEPCRNMRACTFVEKYLIPSSFVNP